jgi:hypothetical protein
MAGHAATDRGPNVEYRQAYERLTGATLPPASALPPVPGAATPGPVDVDDLVRQVEPLVAARAPRAVEGTRSPTVDAGTVDPA